MVGQRTLNPLIQVRILAWEPIMFHEIPRYTRNDKQKLRACTKIGTRPVFVPLSG